MQESKDKFLSFVKNKKLPLWTALDCFDLSQKEIDDVNKASTFEGEAYLISELFPEKRNAIRRRVKYYQAKSSHCVADEYNKFKNTLRTSIRVNLEKNNILANTLSGSMIEFLLGYSISELMSHIESLFDSNMGWDNQGSYWHIDHVYPCSKLKYKKVSDENFKKLWSMENLRPLEAIENIKKADKIWLDQEKK
jgi:hypothetical protein